MIAKPTASLDKMFKKMSVDAKILTSEYIGWNITPIIMSLVEWVILQRLWFSSRCKG